MTTCLPRSSISFVIVLDGERTTSLGGAETFELEGVTSAGNGATKGFEERGAARWKGIRGTGS